MKAAPTPTPRIAQSMTPLFTISLFVRSAPTACLGPRETGEQSIVATFTCNRRSGYMIFFTPVFLRSQNRDSLRDSLSSSFMHQPGFADTYQPKFITKPNKFSLRGELFHVYISYRQGPRPFFQVLGHLMLGFEAIPL